MTRFTHYKHWIGTGACIILGLILITAGLGKLLYQAEFLAVIRYKTFLPPGQVNLIADWFPWIELVVGLLLFTGVAARLAAILSCLLIGAFITHNGWLISQGAGYKPCGCLSLVEVLTQNKFSTFHRSYISI